jgi:Protein of unknown function (DUF2911)
MRLLGYLGGLAVILALIMVLPSPAVSQGAQVRPSLKAGVMQRLGADTDIVIEYSRPGVKGRKIWGALVPYGMAPGNQYSKNQPFPWRAGANENTTISFSKDVLIEGKPLAAGKYGLHMIPSEKEWTIIFSKNSSSWGSFSYKPEEDALRVTVTPAAAPFQEWLSYGFEDLAGTSATAFLHWVELKVPFKISLPK